MGRRGPPKKPKALKRQQGTYRPNRDGNAPVIPPGDLPVAPEGLHEAALAEWHRLAPLCQSAGILTGGDALAWLLMFSELSDWMRMRDECEGAKFLESYANGTFGANPLFKLKNQSASQVLRYLREFGLTPASRAGMNLGTANAEEDDPLKLLMDERESA